MRKDKNKHYFISAALLTAVAFLFLGVLIPLVDPGAPPEFEKEKVSAQAISEPAPSQPQDEALYYPLRQPSVHRGPASESKRKPRKRNPQAVERKAFSPSFLGKRNGDFLWQPDVYAVRDLSKAKSGKYLGAFDRYSIISSESAPSDSFPVVWSKKHKQYGIYTGKIIVISEADGLSSYLRQQGHKFSQLAGSYVVPVNDLDQAFATVKNIKAKFPKTLVDIDINMSNPQVK